VDVSGTDKERVFIITPGRTGSSLLCAVLARAGAEFGIPGRESWNPDSGEMEHPALTRATHLYAKADRLAGGQGKPADPLHAALWAINRSLARRQLAKALGAGRYLKAGNADLALQPALRLGYRPRVILSYRRLEPIVASFLMRSSYFTVDMLVASYVRAMRNGLAAVSLFGGCVVSFEELQSAQETGWAKSIAQLTGLEANHLLDARQTLAKPREPELRMPCLSQEADRLWREAEVMRGRLCGTMRPALRLFRSA
jgi:hypothetical protein